MTTTMPPSLAPKRGDVVLVLFPHSDLRTAKPRPALIVLADDLGTDLPQVIVAMITSKTFRANHSSRVIVKLVSKEICYAPTPETGGIAKGKSEQEQINFWHNQNGTAIAAPFFFVIRMFFQRNQPDNPNSPRSG